MTERPDSNESSAAGHVEHPWSHMLLFCSQAIGNTEGLTMGRMVMKPGESNDRHRNDDREEALYLIRGLVRHEIGDRIIVQERGDFLAVPTGVIHRSTNIGHEEAELIIAYGSGGRREPRADG